MDTRKLMRQLREERCRRGIRLIDLQEAVGYHRTAIGNWERGKYSPPLVALDDLCQAIGVVLIVRFECGCRRLAAVTVGRVRSLAPLPIESAARRALEPKP